MRRRLNEEGRREGEKGGFLNLQFYSSTVAATPELPNCRTVEL